MPLNLYRRHTKGCVGGHPLESFTGEVEERKRGWKRCDCYISASGTLAGRFKRKYTGKINWDEARNVAEQWERRGDWNEVTTVVESGLADSPPVDGIPPLPGETRRVTLEEAVKVFLTHTEGRRIEPATQRKYKSFTNRLTSFAESRGYGLLDQFTTSDIDVFYATWKLGPRTKAKRLDTLRGFFRFCARRKWIAESPVSDDLKPPVGANRVVNKAPFSEEELQRIIAACDRLPDMSWSNGNQTGTWTGEDVKDFIYMLTYTGLRISDIGMFHMNHLRGNEVFLYAKKNGGDVYCYIPDWLRNRLVSRARRRGPRPFIPGRSERIETVTDLWRRQLAKVFELAGRFEERPTPHRFRHTFVRILLESGVSPGEVAQLIADTEQMVLRHYARWVPGRQKRLTEILMKAHERMPAPPDAEEQKLIVISGGRAG